MSNRLASLLNSWHQHKDNCQWVLATIIETQRSSYRKAGAMMLINSLGKSYGLLSGGCLEADLMRQAQKCWLNNNSITVCYDMQDESDIAWQLGIGCGGLVKVLLQPINQANNYLDLLQLKTHIDNRQACFYQIPLEHSDNNNQTISSALPIEASLSSSKQSNNNQNNNTLLITIKPTPAVVIFGGGIDAQPLVSIAETLGWHICLIDSRTSYARPAYFKKAHQIIKGDYSSTELALPKADAIVVMHHNIDLDAQALNLITQHPQLNSAQYIGMLGPQHRTQRVFEKVKLTAADLSVKLANPIGLDLGGELPESIALAILSQAHACIENASAKPLGFYEYENTKAIQGVETNEQNDEATLEQATVAYAH